MLLVIGYVIGYVRVSHVIDYVIGCLRKIVLLVIGSIRVLRVIDYVIGCIRKIVLVVIGCVIGCIRECCLSLGVSLAA